MKSCACYGVLLLVTLLPLSVTAGEILDSSVERDGAEYALTIKARIDAPVSRVHAAITDFDGLAAINPNIKKSRLIGEPDADTQRVHTVIRVCLLMFCKRVVQVQDVTQPEMHVIEAVIVPGASDFRSGYARWQLVSQDAGTVLHFSQRFEPDFWVPPVIGPWIIKRKLVSEVAETSMYIETGKVANGE